MKFAFCPPAFLASFGMDAEQFFFNLLIEIENMTVVPKHINLKTNISELLQKNQK